MNAKALIKLAAAKERKQASFVKAFGPAVALGAGGAFAKEQLSSQSERMFHKLLGLKRHKIKYGDPRKIDEALKTLFIRKGYTSINKPTMVKLRKALWRTYAHAPRALSRAFSAGLLAIPLSYGAALAAKELNK